ncbi:hypothetical protein [Saccharopolyspora cebuensis]|uniref:hypothetical protein n=1 Tax=Saccharopolyspora cebuensis TaxID=418759 RepID=UPI0031F13C13
MRAAGHVLERDGTHFELAVRRTGGQTEVELFRDAERVGSATGLGPLRIPLDEGEPTTAVRVLSPLPGLVVGAQLRVPEADDRAAEQVPFEPPAGTPAARLLAFQRAHPALYASRHVVGAVAKVLLGVLGVAVLVQLVLRRVVEWVLDRLPPIELPRIPWPDIDLPSIPWPDIPWPEIEFHPPGWLLAVLGTAKYWGPVLLAAAVAVREFRRRNRRAGGEGERDDAHR